MRDTIIVVAIAGAFVMCGSGSGGSGGAAGHGGDAGAGGKGSGGAAGSGGQRGTGGSTGSTGSGGATGSGCSAFSPPSKGYVPFVTYGLCDVVNGYALATGGCPGLC
jgi:hypothetical protein